MKLVKRFAAAVAAMALTVAMTTSCFAASWGSYFGQNEGWYEGAFGSLSSSNDTSWTAKMDQIGWGGCWGGQVFQNNLKLKKGTEYQLKFNMTSDTCDKWVFIKIATDDNIAYGDWIQLKAGKTTKYDVTFKAKVDANSIYFGIGGEFGDRADGTDESKGAIYQYSDKLPNDGDSTYATTIKCTNFYLGTPSSTKTTTAATDDNDDDTSTESGSVTDSSSSVEDSASTGTDAAATTTTTTTTTVATGDFAPIACAGIAVAAAAVVVIFSRKREEM